LRFNETPECACFVPTEHVLPQLVASDQITQAEADSLRLELPFLVVGLRGVPYLLYLSLQTLQSFRVSLNENDWDAHVSFVPLALSLSNHGKYLAVATDKDMHLIFQTGTNRRIRILAGGHQCDGYGKPKIAWDPSDLYLFTNCQSDYLLHVYSLASGKEETTYRSQFRQHTGQIRDLRVCSMNRRLLTTSFDRSVIEWSPMN
jgi:WD40 repeat protein